MNKLKILSDLLFSFRGRINRGAWWAVKLLLILPASIGLNYFMEYIAWVYDYAELLGIIAMLCVAYVETAINAKRYHDIGKTGWRQFVALIPLIGGLWLLIECGFKQGDPNYNQYGYPGVMGKSSMYNRGPSQSAGGFESWKDHHPSNNPQKPNTHDIYS